LAGGDCHVHGMGVRVGGWGWDRGSGMGMSAHLSRAAWRNYAKQYGDPTIDPIDNRRDNPDRKIRKIIYQH